MVCRAGLFLTTVESGEMDLGPSWFRPRLRTEKLEGVTCRTNAGLTFSVNYMFIMYLNNYSQYMHKLMNAIKPKSLCDKTLRIASK